ncbi:MAG: hypothetical protein PHO53_00750 [Actinomycetota bacterium]|nr:hypothetical protein [Actinomycetota bacterium]
MDGEEELGYEDDYNEKGEKPEMKPHLEQGGVGSASMSAGEQGERGDSQEGSEGKAEQKEEEEKPTEGEEEAPRSGYPPWYYWPPPWYPPYPPPGAWYPPPGMEPHRVPEKGGKDETTWIPPVPPGATGAFPPPPSGMFVSPYPPPPPIPEEPFPPPRPMEDESLFEEEASHWRGDLKWIFGIIATIVLLSTLLLGGLYKAMSPEPAKEIVSFLVEKTTEVESAVKENYNELKSKAASAEDEEIPIPGIGMRVSVDPEMIKSLGQEDLAAHVADEVAEKIYSEGYRGELEMKYAQGLGEQRAEAFCTTVLALFNHDARKDIELALIIAGGLSLVFLVVFMLFCGGWGKLLGPGVGIILATFPCSLFLRLAREFLWNSKSAGLFEEGAYHVLNTVGSGSLIIFDVGLALGAVFLLAGIIGSSISRARRSRVPPFQSLTEPGSLLEIPQEETVEEGRKPLKPPWESENSEAPLDEA